MTIKDDLFAYIRENLKTKPDYPFARTPDIAIFRHKGSRKWFAAVLWVSREKLGLSGDGGCDVVNLKCDPILSGSFRSLPGVLPGYHMNREHWVSVLLDGTVARDTLWQLVDFSYELTAPAKRRKRKK